MENKAILAALAMDLKRYAVSIHRQSHNTANRFFVEAMKRKSEVNTSELMPYMQKIIEQVGKLSEKDDIHKAEDALMYSTRIQNYVLYK
jgi:hypothetical protein